jgi:hypothetical protein
MKIYTFIVLINEFPGVRLFESSDDLFICSIRRAHLDVFLDRGIK